MRGTKVTNTTSTKKSNLFFSPDFLNSYKIGIAYGYYYDLHITTYGETILLVIQSYLIVALTIKYSGDWTVENGAWLVANGAFVAAIVTKSMPSTVISLLLVCVCYMYIHTRIINEVGLVQARSITTCVYKYKLISWCYTHTVSFSLTH